MTPDIKEFKESQKRSYTVPNIFTPLLELN